VDDPDQHGIVDDLLVHARHQRVLLGDVEGLQRFVDQGVDAGLA